MNRSNTKVTALMPGNSASNLIEIYRRRNSRRDASSPESVSRYVKQLEALAEVFSDANCGLKLSALVEDWSYSRIRRELGGSRKTQLTRPIGSSGSEQREAA